MSLTRQATLLLVGALWLAILGSLGLHAVGMQEALRQQLEVRNRDGASLLALALSQQGGDPTLMQTVAAATFDLGHYRRLALQGADGRVGFELQAGERLTRAPRWLVSALPIQAAPGSAQVSDGWREIGRLEVSAHSAWAYETLWSTLQRTALLLAVLGLLAAAVAVAVLRAWQRPLDVTVAQAQALEEGRFVIADEPRAPELRRLTRSMNSMVQRLHQWFDAQAAQVDALQQQAHTDAVTGLANRRRFIGQLDSAQSAAPAHVGALLMVRVQDLQGLNARLGHEAVDAVLSAIAAALQSYPNQVTGAFVGRLNGSDFALALPVAGLADETAASLMQALRVSTAARAGEVRLVIGGVDGVGSLRPPALLASADAALARAEAIGPFAVQVQRGAADSAVQTGSQAWRRGIEQALDGQRHRLAERPVRARDGSLLYLACPLQLQFEPDGEFLDAGHWMALAARSRLLPRVDLAAVELALQAIAGDASRRCVQVAAASLAAEGFIEQVQARLERQPDAARLLVLEVVEPAADPQARALRDAVAAWRGSGAQVGIEDRGGSLQGRSWLQSLPLSHVTIGSRFVAGLAEDGAVRDYARGLATLVHGLGLRLVATDIDATADLAALWQLGVDGACGAAVA